ncbi:hypothetical protein [Clostridium manihotivorum]|uniref:Uncharacterized protein n=1 Tax=Clostridium manihotivorum TaxID=2320868 RepID=A0A3R5TCV5_9CLOT|nr:hypothetical protein [Clostridium manihotivorum]QAA30383.1 hypothetical protein C1I91_01060 [Clostridium manihotivorum]
MVDSFHVDIPQGKKENFFSLLVYIMLQVFINLIMPIASVIIIILCLNKGIFKPNMVINIAIFMFLIFMSIVIEETFHASILIIQGRGDQVKSLQFDTVKLKKVRICIGVSVYFNGKFNNNDILYISLAGPIMSLFWGVISIFFTIIFFIAFKHTIYIRSVLRLIFGFLIVPFFSLMPLNKYFITTDGYKVYMLIRKFNISLKNVLKVIHIIYKYSLTFVFRSFK